MRSPLWYKVTLLFSAYTPLFLILFVKFFDFKNIYSLFVCPKNVKLNQLFNTELYNDLLAMGSLIMFVISILCSVYIKLEIQQTLKKEVARIDIHIKTIHSRDKDVLVYLVTYILPLISLSTNTINDFLIFIILILLIFWLSIFSDLLYINPLLFIFGKRLYEIESANRKYLIITDKNHTSNIRIGKKIIGYRLDTHEILISKGQIADD
ncbi:hypothetical protein IEE86_11525 [Bacillus sp. 28A-2]|uniref:hypothetical protein n=1 Tax=Bacillus sp. 28A-2 TaxID=2772252 RepID=UPI00168D777F|nr:hypothetical protein [Bacillus sp. 28A-2]MBD3860362.1 hypothetical protein [Bacillus sp. 28A-2]